MTTSNKDRLFTLINDMSDEEQQDLITELEERQSRDMRRHERQSSSVSVDYVAQDHNSKGVIKDISIGGVSLETSEIGGSFSIGEDIILTIQYPNQEKYIKIRGEVVRIEPQRIGVQFKKLS
ncbi:MAG: PilZ domain-containing protein [Proteobacteria bacterium]|nr:PilZ domain-containing protein [Pseudomonadota bacterium]